MLVTCEKSKFCNFVAPAFEILFEKARSPIVVKAGIITLLKGLLLKPSRSISTTASARTLEMFSLLNAFAPTFFARFGITRFRPLLSNFILPLDVSPVTLEGSAASQVKSFSSKSPLTSSTGSTI